MLKKSITVALVAAISGPVVAADAIYSCAKTAEDAKTAAKYAYSKNGIKGLQELVNIPCANGTVQIMLNDAKTGKSLNGRTFDPALSKEKEAADTWDRVVKSWPKIHSGELVLWTKEVDPKTQTVSTYSTFSTLYGDAFLTVYGRVYYREPSADKAHP
jgi:hypothetical protein